MHDRRFFICTFIAVLIALVLIIMDRASFVPTIEKQEINQDCYDPSVDPDPGECPE